MRIKVLVALIFALLGGCYVANGQQLIGRPFLPLVGNSNPCSADYNLTAINPNLVAYWRFDETGTVSRVDSSPNGTAADLAYNATVGSAPYVITNASTFSGSGFLRNAAASKLNFNGTNSFSMWGWLSTGLPGATMILVDFFGGTFDQYLLSCNGTTNNNLEWKVWTTDNNFTTSFATVVNTNVPTFFCVWYENNGPSAAGKVCFQLNNGTTNVATTALANSTPRGTPSSTFQVGRYQNAASLDWWGYIDEMGVANRILTENERAALYRCGSGRTIAAGGFQ